MKAMKIQDLKACEIETDRNYALIIGGKARFYLEIHSDDGEVTLNAIRDHRDFLIAVEQAMIETALPEKEDNP